MVLWAGPFVAKSLSEHLSDMAPATLKAIEGFVSREAPGAWHFVLSPLLHTPTALFFGVLSVLAGYLGRRRHTIEIFAN